MPPFPCLAPSLVNERKPQPPQIEVDAGGLRQETIYQPPASQAEHESTPASASSRPYFSTATFRLVLQYGIQPVMLLALLIVSLVLLTSAAPSPYQWQQSVSSQSQDDWQKYVRSPPSQIVRPASVLPNYTVGNVTNPDGLLTGKGATILTRSPGTSTTPDIQPQIVVDWGQNIVGFLSIDFGGAYNVTPGLPGIRLAFSETLGFLTNLSDFTRSYNGDSITPGTDQVAVLPDPYTWTDTHGCEYEGTKVCADGLHGFRYMRIYLDALPADAPYTSSYGQVEISSMTLNFTGYLGTSDTFSGWFESSDDQINQWWYDGVYTNDMCTDTFRMNDTDPRNAGSPSLLGKLILHDGAKRDRDPYVGDLSVAALTTYLSHDVSQASRNVLADLADHQRSDGWIPPASINGYTLPLVDYPLHWVKSSYDLFMYTNDIAYIQRYYQNIINTLDNFYPSITSSTTNLITKGLGVSGGYGDYAFLPRSGPVTYYNALYVLALNNAASIATYLGNTNDASRWTARAQKVSAAINQYNFDSSVGAFFDGTCGSDTNYCSTHAQDGNSLAIVSGAVPSNSSRALSALSYLSSNNARPYGNSFYDNDVLSGGFSQRVYAFISYFEIQARFITGQADSALEEIRRLYGWMASHDPEITQWEGIGDNGTPYEGSYTSHAHGWATGIVPLCSSYLLGVQPTGPGFSSYSIKPMPGDLSWARGVVPTPNGPITVSWNSDVQHGFFYLSSTAPAGTTGTIYVPVGNSSVPVYVDGQQAWDGQSSVGFNAEFVQGEGYVGVSIEDGDNHIVTVGYAGPSS